MIIENKRKAYDTDLTDKQWEMIEPLMWKSGNKSKWEKRELINAVLYLVDSGCKWRQLPHDFPPYTTCFSCFLNKHFQNFIPQSFPDCFPVKIKNSGKNENPTYALIDSQSVKTVYNSEKRGFDGGKKRKDESGT